MRVLDIKIDPLSFNEAKNRFRTFIMGEESHLITTVNSEFIVKCQTDSEFKAVLNNKSDINFADAYGLIWGLWLTSLWKPKTKYLKEIFVSIQWLILLLLYPLTPLLSKKAVPARISGSDFIWEMCRIAAREKKSIFLLGNKFGLDPSGVEKVSLELQTKIYDLKIAGALSSTPDKTEEQSIIESIKKSGADIVFVGFGAPMQEKWLARNLHKTNAKVGVGLGGTFDFITGAQKRAPKWIRMIGFEWLFRLIQHPKRIVRQLALPKFAIMILIDRLKS
jgi:N-acetylglucosaminyldiphosphoundecaprenol N-acetyl-beta-D-mannosaminyltransferase